MNDTSAMTAIQKIIRVYGINRIHEELNIPIRTLQNWLYGMTTPPEYVTILIEYYYEGSDSSWPI